MTNQERKFYLLAGTILAILAIAAGARLIVEILTMEEGKKTEVVCTDSAGRVLLSTDVGPHSFDRRSNRWSFYHLDGPPTVLRDAFCSFPEVDRDRMSEVRGGSSGFAASYDPGAMIEEVRATTGEVIGVRYKTPAPGTAVP